MYRNAKNTAKGLVVSKKSPIFALPKKRNSANPYIVDSTLWAYPCSTSALRSCASLARNKGVRPICTYTTTFDEQCQRRSKVVGRSIVTRLRNIMRIAHSLLERSCARIFQSPTSFGSKSTVNPRLRHIVSSRLSRPANRSLRSGQLSSSSSIVLSLSGSTTSLSLGANSRNFKSICHE